MARVSKPITKGYNGWVVIYPVWIDKLMTFLWNRGLCHKLITRSIDRNIQKAERTGKFTYCEVVNVDRDLR